MDENEDEAWKTRSHGENVFNSSPEEQYYNRDSDVTPSFALKNVVSKFSSIKSGFDSENVSFYGLIFLLGELK